MAELDNYGVSPGVDCRTGETVYNKLSCQSLRIFPAPPGFWEQELCLPVCGTGPEAQKQREDMARGAMFGSPNFISCRHPACWICIGQKTHPTAEQIAAFSHPPATRGPLPRGVLSGEHEALYGRPPKRNMLKRLVGCARAFYHYLRGKDHEQTDVDG